MDGNRSSGRKGKNRPPTAHVIRRDDRLEVRFAYDSSVVTHVKELGGQWNQRDRCWSFPANAVSWKSLRGLFQLKVQLPPLPASCGEAVRELEAEVLLRRFSARTRKAYVSHVQRCLRHAG